MKNYFQEVIKTVADANELLIMGPASAKFELEKEIQLSNDGASKAITVITEGRLTENQMVASIKKFFNSAAD